MTPCHFCGNLKFSVPTSKTMIFLMILIIKSCKHLWYRPNKDPFIASNFDLHLSAQLYKQSNTLIFSNNVTMCMGSMLGAHVPRPDSTTGCNNASIRLDVTRLLKISHAHLRSSIAVTYRSAPSRMRIREFSLDTRLTVWRTLVENVRLATFLWDKHVCHRNIHSWHILRCNTCLE